MFCIRSCCDNCFLYSGVDAGMGLRSRGSILMAKTPAWQRSEGQSKTGGLNAKSKAAAMSARLKPKK